MIATAKQFASFTPTSAGSNGQPRQRRAWAPNADDHQIYRWVRFDGKSQSWAAGQLGISQATVSRVVQRYERWQAHADPRDGGRLDPAERARAQRWLTLERNEMILASCLRIAQEMEGFTEVSKSVTSRPMGKPSAEREVRTESAAIDRSGVAARFLRLAFRINMEQHKLVEFEPAALPEPLSEEELAEQEAEAAAAREEIQAARKASEARIDQLMAEHLAANGQWEALRNLEESQAAGDRELEVEGQRPEVEAEPESIPFTREEAMHEVHNLHHANGEEVAVSSDAALGCDATCQPGKTGERVCIAQNATEGVPYSGKEGAAYGAKEGVPYNATKVLEYCSRRGAADRRP